MPDGESTIEPQPKIESIAHHRRTAAAAQVIETGGRVTYIGRPLKQWAEIMAVLALRNIEVHDAGDSREPLSPRALAASTMIVVGENVAVHEPHEICREIRRQGYRGPLLLLGGNDAIGRILALENGADTWLDEDADLRTAVAQIRALLRLGKEVAAYAPTTQTLRAGAFVLNPASREVAVGGARRELSTSEFELLWALVKNAGEVVPREQLADLVGCVGDAPTSRAIDTLVSRLRQRIGKPYASQIRAIRAIGYMLCTQSLFELIERGSVHGG